MVVLTETVNTGEREFKGNSSELILDISGLPVSYSIDS